jgi:hypothetical protein
MFFGLGCIFSCKKQNNSLEQEFAGTGAIFFNEPQNKLWRHRVDNIDDFQNYAQYFKGVELDVIYYEDIDAIEVEHDEDSTVSISLNDYFGSMENPDDFYYWMDIKNLSNTNVEKFIEHLNQVFDFFGIKNQVICESYMVEPLAILHDNGFYTSYWIPHFDYSGTLDSLQTEKLNLIKANLNTCPFNAISAAYQMFPFIKDHLSNCTTHLWTNGLLGDEDKEQIRNFMSYDFVKVILVDYEEPFE